MILSHVIVGAVISVAVFVRALTRCTAGAIERPSAGTSRYTGPW